MTALPLRPAPAAPPPPRQKPRLRGASHVVAALASPFAVAWLVHHATSGTAQTGALIYGASLLALFGVSALYHSLFWSLAIRKVLGRIDHSAIFLLIAGTYTPLGLLLGPGWGHGTLIAVWVGALLGIALVLGWEGLPKRLRASIYVLLGWVIFPVVPQLRAVLGDSGLLMLFAGGLLYTVGAVIYAMRRPDPYPETFGFHEIFHLLVVGAAACHFAMVASAVRLLG